jgi:hypothetical protein
VRKLPSGRYQASFVGPSGTRQNAPQTFRTKTDADRWLSTVETDISRGTWLDEDLGREPFGTYATAWLRDHPKMGPRYRETCERNLRLHLEPLREVPLRAMTSGVVREWYATALRGKGGRASIAQSYRFLHAVMNTRAPRRCDHQEPLSNPGRRFRPRERASCSDSCPSRRSHRGDHAPIPGCRPAGRLVRYAARRSPWLAPR